MAFRTNAGLLIKPAPRNPFVATTVASESHNRDWDPRHHLPTMLSSLRPGRARVEAVQVQHNPVGLGRPTLGAGIPKTGADAI